MSEDRRRSSKQHKTLHVDTLHIHANEVVFHQERRPEDGPGQQQNQIPRDFWGFPIRPMLNPQTGEENNEGAEAGNENESGEQRPQQGPPPGWI
jgi:hypothetical protein